MMLGVDGHLHVVADHASAPPACRHGARVRIGEGDLFIGSSLHLLSHLFEGLHLPFEARDFFLQAARLGLGHIAVLAVRALQGVEIARNGSLHLRYAFLNFGSREILVPVVDCFELAAIDGDNGLSEQVQLAAYGDELRADRADCRAIVAAEIGDGLEIGHQAACQPHQFDVALGFSFKPAARRNTVQVTVEIDL